MIRSAALLQRHDQQVVGDRIEGLYKGQLAGLRSDWSFGLDFSVNKQTRFPNSLPATVSTVNPTSSPPSPSSRCRACGRASTPTATTR